MFKRLVLFIIILLSLSGQIWAEPGPGPGAPIGGISNTFTGSFFDFNSSVRLRNHLGPELVTNGTFTGAATGWTLGTGWAYSANTVVKNADGTGTLSPTTALTITANSIYRVAYVVSSMTVSSVTASIGGVTLPVQSDDDSAAVFYVTATASTNLVFTPTNTSRFTIDNVSVKKVGTAGTDTVVLFEDDRDSVAGGGSLFSLGESGGHSIRIGNTGIGLGDSAQVNHQNAGTANYEYGVLGKINSGAGGLNISGYTDADGTALALNCLVGSEDPTDTTPICKVVASKKSGSTSQALGALETVLQILNSTTGLVTITGSGNVFIGDPVNTKSTLGLTINQADKDDEILSLKSTDVAHDFTSLTESSTYGKIIKNSSAWGGVHFAGMTDADSTALSFNGWIGVTDPADDTAAILISGRKLSGTSTAFLGNAETALAIQGNPNFISRFLGSGSLLINETVNTKSTIGLTINQAANDDEILSFKSSDVVHVGTNLTEADTFGRFGKVAGANGGLSIIGTIDDGTAGAGLYLSGERNAAAGTVPVILLNGSELSGGNAAPIDATDILFAIRNDTNGNVFTMQGNGSVYINDSSNANSTIGLTIQQGANDNTIFALKSSDVGHTFSFVESDTYAYMQKLSATAGGLFLGSMTDGDATAMMLLGMIGNNDPADTTPAIKLIGGKLDVAGTGLTVLGDAETVLQVLTGDSVTTTALFTVLGNGYTGVRDATPAVPFSVSGYVAQDATDTTASLNSGNATKNTTLQFRQTTTPRWALTSESGGANFNIYQYTAGWLIALDLDSNLNMGLATSLFGTNAAKVFAIGSGIPPTTSPADASQLWSADRNGLAGKATLHTRDESGRNGPLAIENNPIFASPIITKGPAIVNAGFVGTVTATASTTVTFSSAADAILAGYDATNPVLGVTLISNALTRYIVSWTNSTTCVVDSSVTWAGTAITSIQFPIGGFVNSAGVAKGWMLASGVNYFVENFGIGTTTFGTSLAGGLAMGVGTAPTGTITGAQVVAANRNSVASTARLHEMTQTGIISPIALQTELDATVNSKAMSQAVNMTPAASGSTGITVADNDNIDFVTGNFTLAWKGSLPSWVASSILLQKLTGGVGYQLETVVTTGIIRLTLNATAYNSSVAPVVVAGTNHEIMAVVTVGAVNTTVDFYFDGVPLGTQQTAANPGTVSNAASLYVLGTSAVRTAGTASNGYTYNRALTAAEVLSLYNNGVGFADKWGNSASLNTTACVNGDYETFDGASATGFHVIGTAAAFRSAGTFYEEISIVNGYKYSIEFDLSLASGTAPNIVFATNLSVPAYLSDLYQTVAGHNFATLTATETDAGSLLVFFNTNAATEYTVSNLRVVRAGTTLALESEGIQVDVWKDSSTNGLNASYPTAGSSFTRPFPTNNAEQLLSVTNVSLAANADTTIYTVPTGKRLVITKAILIAGADAGATSTIAIGADGTETDWIPANTLSNLDAANDSVILVPVPNTTPVKSKSYAAGTVIQAQVGTQSGGATNALYLFGFLY